jgi:hypothetical protein
VQPAGLGARLNAELLVQPGLELPVPAQRQVALPGERVGPDDGRDRLLAQPVGGGQPLQGGRGPVRVAGRLQAQHLVAGQVLGASAWRAKWTALRRLAAAASGARSGQSTSISCSRCSRFPWARARSLTSALA